jgi:hypothetical protein
MPYSNLSVVIPNEAVAAIYAAIATIKTNLPFLINLTNDEKMAMIKMGEGSIQFVSKALAYGKSTPSIVPPYTDLNELGRDLAATSVMLPIAAEIDKLATAVSDTTIALGNEAMAA